MLLPGNDGRLKDDGRHPTSSISEFIRPADSMYLTAFTDDSDSSIYTEAYERHGYPIDWWYDVWNIKHVNGPEEGSNYYGGNVARISSTRHYRGNNGSGSGSNCLFADSHVELRFKDTLKDENNWDDRTYNYWW